MADFWHRLKLMSGAQQMLLAGGDQIRLDAAAYVRTNTGGATCTFKLDNDGQVYVADNSSGGALTARYSWVIPNAAAANYDVRWSTVSNVVDSTPGAEVTNLNLGTDRTWSETNAVADETCSFSVSIHRLGDTVSPLVTKTISLEADGS